MNRGPDDEARAPVKQHDCCQVTVHGQQIALWRPGMPPDDLCRFTPIRKMALLGRPEHPSQVGRQATVFVCAVHHDPILNYLTRAGVAVISDTRIQRDWAADG